MPRAKEGALIGFLGGIAFALAHLFLNMRYDIPFYVILRGLEMSVTCQGRACLGYVGLAVFLSAVFWAVIGAAIGRSVTAGGNAPSDEMPRA